MAFFRKDPNAKLPTSSYDINDLFDNCQYNGVDDGLHVPQTAPPIGASNGVMQFTNLPDNLFEAPDGTIIDIKTGKVVMKPKETKGYWGDPNRTIDWNKNDW